VSRSLMVSSSLALRSSNSMNYRSVVIFGRARWLRDDKEKFVALRALANTCFQAGGTTCVRPVRPSCGRHTCLPSHC